MGLKKTTFFDKTPVVRVMQKLMPGQLKTCETWHVNGSLLWYYKIFANVTSSIEGNAGHQCAHTFLFFFGF
jgi:hypothetical protein